MTALELSPFETSLTGALTMWQIVLAPQQVAACRVHFELMVERNQRTNLTRIVDPARAAVLHYADSLAIVAWALEADARIDTVLDIGVGAGFPCIPVAIARPSWRIVGIEATRKKADFVAEAAGRLELSNLTVEHAHADHWIARRRFSVVTARAVGSLADCLIAGARFVENGGYVVSYKTPSISPEEVHAADRTARRLGLHSLTTFLYDLRAGDETHHRLLDVRQKKKS